MMLCHLALGQADPWTAADFLLRKLTFCEVPSKCALLRSHHQSRRLPMVTCHNFSAMGCLMISHFSAALP
eukprot:scaffold234642_cov23-Tisochrysis_lutea.AAC.1